MADDAPDAPPPFSEDGAEAREKIRHELHESAVALKRERLEAEQAATDEALRKRIALLGFEGESARIFDLLPLVHVAWADGSIQAGERGTILNLLRIRGIPIGKAYTTMEALLEKRPSQEYLEESMVVLKQVIENSPRPDQAQTIVGLCILVAEAAGGLLGLLNPVSKKEREVIELIAKRLGEGAVAEFNRRLG